MTDYIRGQLDSQNSCNVVSLELTEDTNVSSINAHLVDLVDYPQIFINDMPIQFVDSIKCFGISSDSNLNFGNHINIFSNKVPHIFR